MVKGFMYIESVDENNSVFHGYINFNPKLALVPDWFLNVMIKRVVNKVIIKMRTEKMFE